MSKIKLTGDTSGYIEISAPNVAANNTLELGGGTKILTNLDNVFTGVTTYSGNIDLNANLDLADNNKILLGTGDDLQIYHDGSKSLITDSGTGWLEINTNNLRVQNAAANETLLYATENGSVDLYYDNSKKLETTNTGAVVTGILTATTFSGNLTGNVTGNVTGDLTGNLAGTASIAGISSSISDTAVDVFVYDTRKDSDGGAWRKRTQHTSWYNETLNTQYRGSRREFPSVAVIVAEEYDITIYDADDPDLPMWMLLRRQGWDRLVHYSRADDTSTAYESLAALNGIICVGSYQDESSLQIANFVSDKSEIYRGTGNNYSHGYNPGLVGDTGAAGNDSIFDGTATGLGLVNSIVNDVAMTVLPNAPIDGATELPIPTIFVGTEGGLSIIKHDGNVIDGTSTSGDNYERIQQITITDENYLWWSSDLVFNSSYRRDSYALSLDALPSGNFTWDNSTDNLSTGAYYSVSTGGESGEIQIGNSNTWAFNHLERNALGGGAGFAIHKPKIGSETDSLFALITSDYNSGYLPGDCKGAFLADTDTTNKTNGQTDPDRSKYNYALSVTGTINKSVVATGADLVGYHGFTSSNYLRHTNGINYGNAARIIMGGWSKIPGSAVDSNYNYLCSVKSGGEVLGLSITIDNGGSHAGKPYFYDVTNSSLQSDGPRVDDNQWHHILGVLDGTSKKIYIDGELIASATVTGINLSSVNITNVGHYVPGNSNTPEYNHGGYLALIKFSASVPTDEQVKKMYEDEKVLFQENAKATLYGSSNAVTGLAYDDSTELYHVGTSAGRSDFQGLRRINNTTTAVTTAISASDELIAEQ